MCTPLKPLANFPVYLGTEIPRVLRLHHEQATSGGTDLATVQGDPETDAAHMGGGRSYMAEDALRLGMVDRVATLDETIARLARPVMARQRAEIGRQRLALI